MRTRKAGHLRRPALGLKEGARRGALDKIPTLTQADLELPHDELGKLFLGFVIAAEAHASGVPFDQVTETHAVQIVELLKRAEATEAKYTAVEKAVQKAIDNDFATAGRLIKEHMLDNALNMIALNEAMTRKLWRREISSGDRGDTLTKMIRQLVEDANGDISEAELRISLETDSSGIIDEITDDEIWYVSADGTGRHTRLSNLRGRLSRAKKKYKDNSSR